jgi:hypothetical protein
MASSAIRKPWYARPTFWSLIIIGWLITMPLAEALGSWVWFALVVVLVAIDVRNPGSKGKPTDLPTTAAPDAVSTEVLSAAKPQSVFSYLFGGRSKHSKMELALAQHQTYQTRLTEEMAYFQTLLDALPDFNAVTDNEEQVLVIEGVSLVEPRKGPRVTESSSRSAGRPFIGIPVGGVFLGASGRSSSKSRSVSTQGADELTLVESNGRFIASTQGIAYVGEMFNRKADYSAIIDWTGEGFQLRISASGKGTNWIVIFSRPADMWAAGTLLDAADEIPARSLDTSGKATAQEIAAAIAESIGAQKEKFAEAETIAQVDVAAIQSQIELLRKQYPSRVK